MGGHAAKEFKIGDEFSVECQTGDSEKPWGPGPICDETGKELTFRYGQDNFFYCGLRVQSERHFNWLGSVVHQENNWNCRAPLTPERKFFLPFSIPLWGVKEEDHIHVDNHFNFIFHGDAGHIIGVAAYPLRDRFQFAKLNSVINFHGPVRWFHRHSFTAMSSLKSSAVHSNDSHELSTFWMTLGWCLLSVILTLITS